MQGLTRSRVQGETGGVASTEPSLPAQRTPAPRPAPARMSHPAQFLGGGGGAGERSGGCSANSQVTPGATCGACAGLSPAPGRPVAPRGP